ncbi:MAG TPA: patatin-like phospholipase family protein [Terriglobales bacterium]|jgi:NTE family protein
MRSKFLSIIGTTLLMSSMMSAQESQAVRGGGKRPSLGLVLEGGGALGLAHVGVITWLEEHHIPVNYVAGTSMGGLVGGVYATGADAKELRQLVNSIEWDEVLSGQPSYRDLSFRRKEDAHDYPNNLEFGWRKGLQFPAGFNTGQDVSFIIDRVAFPYSEVANFNELPIPYTCVATNLVSGRPEVFRSGSLSLAMRATMSIPGVFTPVTSKEAIYADGGLLNNIPIDVAKEMGAELILGVHLETAPLSPDAKLSSLAVLGRSVSIMIAANELRSMEDADLMISVPLAKYGSMDFNKAPEIIQAGYDAAEAKAKVLSAFAVDDATWAQYLQERESRRRTNPTPAFVEVTGAKGDLAKQVQDYLSPMAGKPVDFPELDQRIREIRGWGRFSAINYGLTRRGGEDGLNVATDDKPYGSPIVRPLILIDGSNFENVLFNMGARLTWLDLGGYGSEFRNDIILFSEYGLRSEYYHPFTQDKQWFVAPRGLITSDPIYIYAQNTNIATFRETNAGGGIDVGHQFGRTAELRIGYEGGWQKFERQSGDPTLPVVSGGYGATRVGFRLNTLDDAVVPREGQRFELNWRWTNASPASPNQYPALEVLSQNFFRLSAPSSVFINGFAGTTFDHSTGVPVFSLGGTSQLVSYGTNELLMDKYFLFQGGYLRKLLRLPPLLGGGVYGLGLIEGGQVYGRPLTGLGKFPNYPGDIAAGVVVTTLFGPVELAYAYGDTGHHKFFFRIGRLF